MIIVSRSEQEGTTTLLVRGHAGYAAAGRDIVCAGVSALVFAYLAYLEGLAPSPEAKTDAENVPNAGTSAESVTPPCETADTESKPTDNRSPERGVRRRLGNGMLEVTSSGLPEEREAWALVRTGIALLAAAYPHHVRLLGPSAGEADDTIITTMRKEPKHEKTKHKSVPSRRGRGKTN